MCRIYGCPEKFREFLTTSTATFPKIWAFVAIDPMNVGTKFEVRSFTRSWDNRGFQKNLDSPWIRPRKTLNSNRHYHKNGLQIWPYIRSVHPNKSPLKVLMGFWWHWKCRTRKRRTKKTSKVGKCRTENAGPSVTRWKMQDRKMQDQKSLGGICRTGKCRTRKRYWQRATDYKTSLTTVHLFVRNG